MLDAITGQNAISQAEEFCKAANATGVVLTKLDGTPRGGCAVSVWENLGTPIRFIGVGEKIDDLMEFDAQTFVESLLPESALQKDEKKRKGGERSLDRCAASSNNAGKLKELRRILERMGHEVQEPAGSGDRRATPRKPARHLPKTPASRPRRSARPAACPPWPMTRASTPTRCTVRPASTAPLRRASRRRRREQRKAAAGAGRRAGGTARRKVRVGGLLHAAGRTRTGGRGRVRAALRLHCRTATTASAMTRCSSRRVRRTRRQEPEHRTPQLRPAPPRPSAIEAVQWRS